MAISFAIIGDITASAGKFLTDEDAMILEKYKVEARNRITEFTDSESRADDIVSTLGWA
jgi:hypothetical protein